VGSEKKTERIREKNVAEQNVVVTKERAVRAEGRLRKE
jgi:hypothetical protein